MYGCFLGKGEGGCLEKENCVLFCKKCGKETIKDRPTDKVLYSKVVPLKISIFFFVPNRVLQSIFGSVLTARKK